jgi:hypothetical protein
LSIHFIHIALPNVTYDRVFDTTRPEMFISEEENKKFIELIKQSFFEKFKQAGIKIDDATEKKDETGEEHEKKI